MRLPILLLLSTALFSCSMIPTPKKIALETIVHQLKWIKIALINNDESLLAKYYYFQDATDPDEVGAIVDEFKNSTLDARLGYFASKTEIRGYVDKVTDGSRTLYEALMWRSPWSPSNWILTLKVVKHE